MIESNPAAVRMWTVVVLAAAAAVVLGGNARESFRPEPSGAIPADTPLPVLHDPQGDLPAPPSQFAWTPGGNDVDLAQVVLFKSNLEVFWQSGPLSGPPLTVDPAEVFAGIPAGEPLAWRVREVSGGKPRASSDLVVFSFAVDTQGIPAGESRPALPARPTP